MSDQELASRELSEWRQTKAAELSSKAVLSEEAAARFSTAAALAFRDSQHAQRAREHVPILPATLAPPPAPLSDAAAEAAAAAAAVAADREVGSGGKPASGPAGGDAANMEEDNGPADAGGSILRRSAASSARKPDAARCECQQRIPTAAQQHSSTADTGSGVLLVAHAPQVQPSACSLPAHQH
jgi:hypothetical protein